MGDQANQVSGASASKYRGHFRSSRYVQSSCIRAVGMRALDEAAVSQASKRRLNGEMKTGDGSSACALGRFASVGCVESSRGSGVSRDLSSSGVELDGGAAAEFVVLEPVTREVRPRLQPARVGRVVSDSKRDHLALQRLVGR